MNLFTHIIFGYLGVVAVSLPLMLWAIATAEDDPYDP